MSSPRFSPLRSCHYRRGFTLSELLVAIALIAALLALLLGAVSMVGAQGDATRCISHLRSVGGALSLYLADHRGELPPMSALKNPADPKSAVLTGQEALSPYLQIPADFNWRQNTPTASTFGVWICPADRESRPSKVQPTLPRWKAMNSYLLNYYIGKGVVTDTGGNQNSRTVLRITEVMNPQQILYYADGYRADGGQGRMTEGIVSAANDSPDGAGSGSLRFRHRQTLHALTLGGNVLALTPEDLRSNGERFTVPAKSGTP